MSITCSECVFVDLNIQHEKRVRRVYSHLWPLPFYSICLHCLTNGLNFGKQIIENITCVLIFSATFV